MCEKLYESWPFLLFIRLTKFSLNETYINHKIVTLFFVLVIYDWVTGYILIFTGGKLFLKFKQATNYFTKILT